MPKKTKKKIAKGKIGKAKTWKKIVKAKTKSKPAVKKQAEIRTEIAPVSLMPTMLGFTSGIAIRDEGRELVADAQIPGAKAEEIKVEVQPNSIRVWVEKKEHMKETGKGYYYESSSYGSESKFASLPESVDPKSAKVDASNGQVTVRMAKKS
jgi:HSP20 family molecular chaperone IbpA